MKAEGWELATLSEVADLHQGIGFPKHLQGREAGDLGFYKVSDISRAVAAGSEVLGPAAHCISHKEAAGLRAIPVPRNSVVFARIGEAIRLNRRALLPSDALIDNNVIGVKARAGISDRFLYYFLKTVKLGELSQATTVPAVRTSDIAAIEVPVAPSNEQLRIVSKLDELFSRIDEGEHALERVQKLVERYRQSVLKAAVTGELTREWREKNKDKLESGEALLARILKTRREAWEKAELAKMKAKGITPADDKWKQRYEEPSPPDTTGLAGLPEGWVWATPVQLESSIANALTIGPFGSNLKVTDYRTEGVPLIFVRHIRSSSFSMNDGKFVSVEKAQELATHTAHAGDVLVTKMGDPPGDACVYPLGSPDAIITADCIKWTLHPLLFSRGYFAEFINSALGRSQIAMITKGVAQQKVSLERFRQIAVAVPGPEEQAQITERLEVEAQRLDKVGDAIARERRRSFATRQSILRTAFDGSLVHQDSTDEPASVLLERVASERASDNAAPKRGRKKKASA